MIASPSTVGRLVLYCWFNTLILLLNCVFSLMSTARKTTAVLLAVFLAVSVARAENAATIDVVDSLQETLLAVMKDANALGLDGRYEKLLPSLTEAFDFEHMIRFASGSSWRTATAEQRDALVNAFTRMSVSTYAAQFNGYSGEIFETVGQRDGPRDSILVDTQIIRKTDPPVAITYVMTRTDGQWRIVDLLLEKKVSEIAIRRSEYNPILREGGPDELIAALNAKADKLLTK